MSDRVEPVDQGNAPVSAAPQWLREAMQVWAANDVVELQLPDRAIRSRSLDC